MTIANAIVPQEPNACSLETRKTCRAALSNGLIEQTFDSATRVNALAVLVDGKVTEGLSGVPVPEARLLFQPVESELIENRRLILPSRPASYGSTAELVAEIGAHLDKYVVFPRKYRPLMSLYVMFTWLYDRFKTVPYLRFIGDMGVGKSRALKVVGSLCYHPYSTAGSATMAPIFRGLKLFGGGTLVMDELDFYVRNEMHQEMMTMLRQGFENGPGVLRSTGDDHCPTDFPVFGPKVLAGRKSFPDEALESRCVRIYMQSGLPHGHVPVELPPSHMGEVIELQNKLLQWRFDNFLKPLVVVERLKVESRLNQLYLPLASVVHDPAAGNALREAVLALQDEMSEARRESREGRVLKALLDLVAEVKPADAPYQVLLKDVAGRVAGSVTSKLVRTICEGFGLKPGPRTNLGATVLFDPKQCADAIRQYGLDGPQAEGPVAAAA